MAVCWDKTLLVSLLYQMTNVAGATLYPRPFLNMYFDILSFLREEEGKVEAREEEAVWRKRNIGFSLTICKYKCIQYNF